jgi:ABC-type multidrug transport system fused ATPase/permease subunit
MKALTITPHTFLSKVALDGKSAENTLTEIIKFENGNLGEITNIGKFKELRWTDAFIKSDRDVAVGFRWGISSAGKLTVVTGNDGAGKIALINSIIRMQDLEKGRIFIEGTKETYRVDQLDLDYWLRQVSWVSQNPNFIDGTVEENLKLIKPRANKEMLHDLLSQVNLTVEELSDGLATKIYGQQGGLSQSQLQRLAIARLILKDSPIAIFDDFSISLDLDNQKFFHIVLKELARKGKVVLAISDNEDLIKLADRVISLESSKEKVQI